ncbi:DUF1616 domain-containing protein [Haladaptatus caseinilyticus]|uniref:DUF1616 domain-containing protein n=1 Tax=Haladaptatus caseinilyticus TaxID=2993314 RepID=UPI00224AA7F3|nr:DUF1616 domain-containing protein [Haladaptatus caseinilyticus]
MSTNSRWWFIDLVLTLILTGISGFAVIAGVGGRLRVALVLPLVVFLPGYVFISALFPEGGEGEIRVFGDDTTDVEYAVGGPERVGLAVVASIAIVPMVAALANFTPWGVRLMPILVGVVCFTILSTLIAFIRRWRVPSYQRYSPGLPGLLFNSTDRRVSGKTTSMINIGIVISFLLVASSVGFAVLNPPQGEQFTEFNIEGQDINSNTETFYQVDLDSGLTVNVTNHEGERTRYTVVAVLERVQDGSVSQQTQIGEQQVTIESEQKKQVTFTTDRSLSGDNVRVRLLLYKGEPSGSPYKVLRLWLSQQSSATEARTTNGGDDESEGDEETQPTETSTPSSTSSPDTETQTSSATTQPPFTTTTSQSTFGTTTTQPRFTTTTSQTGFTTRQTTQRTSTTTSTTTDDGLFASHEGDYSTS